MTKRHKETTFLELLEPHRRSLYRFCRNIIWDKNDVEDALQTAILSAYKSFDTFQKGGNFKAWIFKFLVNTVYNFNKKHGRKDTFETRLDCDEPGILEVFEKESMYQEILKDPDRLLERVDERVKRSLFRLSLSERAVFLLRSIEGLSYKEISEVLQIPVGTVMSQLSRARAKLREFLCDYAKEIGFFADRND